MKSFRLLAMFVVVALLQTALSAAAPMKALIIDGQNNHRRMI